MAGGRPLLTYHIFTRMHTSEPMPRAQPSKRARTLAGTMTGLSKARSSKPAKSGLAITIMDHRLLLTSALDWPYYLVWRPGLVHQPCFSAWGHRFTELLMISFCGSARYCGAGWWEASRAGGRVGRVRVGSAEDEILSCCQSCRTAYRMPP